MLMHHPAQFDKVAREWSVKYAGAPKSLLMSSTSTYQQSSKPKIQKTKEQELREQIARYMYHNLIGSGTNTVLNRYQGYNKDLIDRFVNMGFDIDKVVEAFNFVGIDRNDGQDYELEEAYMGDITARLLGEP
jgi:ubiquitin-conjugating enzyme (huntingtin interacting protein 2)